MIIHQLEFRQTGFRVYPVFEQRLRDGGEWQNKSCWVKTVVEVK